MACRRLAALSVALVFVVGASGSILAEDKKKEPKKLTKQEQADVETLVKLTDAVTAGQPAPADMSVVWEQSHFLKAQDGKTFVPFTLNIDTKGLSANALSLYVRAVKKGAAPADKKDNKKVEYPWDDVQFMDVPSTGHLSRALAVSGGEYDLYVAVKEKSTGKKGESAKTTLLKRDLSVPEYTNAALHTSSIILAESVEPTQPLDPDTQRANPYTFSTMKVTPSLEGKFKKTGELNLVFWVYGVTPTSMQKPDVQVDYNFHQKLPEGEKYFNKTAPQVLDAKGLPPEFDLSVGHLVMGSLSVPLASFPAGDYRLEIKITDKPSGKTFTQNVTFNVA